MIIPSYNGDLLLLSVCCWKCWSLLCSGWQITQRSHFTLNQPKTLFDLHTRCLGWDSLHSKTITIMRRRNLRENSKQQNKRENVSQLCQAPHTLTNSSPALGKTTEGTSATLSSAQISSTGAGHGSQVPLVPPPEHVQSYVFWNVWIGSVSVLGLCWTKVHW